MSLCNDINKWKWLSEYWLHTICLFNYIFGRKKMYKSLKTSSKEDFCSSCISIVTLINSFHNSESVTEETVWSRPPSVVLSLLPTFSCPLIFGSSVVASVKVFTSSFHLLLLILHLWCFTHVLRRTMQFVKWKNNLKNPTNMKNMLNILCTQPVWLTLSLVQMRCLCCSFKIVANLKQFCEVTAILWHNATWKDT